MSTAELSKMIVAEIMARWPATIHVFMRRRMSCPGCPMAPFMTAADAAREYGVPPEELTGDLQREIEAAPGTRPRAAI